MKINNRLSKAVRINSVKVLSDVEKGVEGIDAPTSSWTRAKGVIVPEEGSNSSPTEGEQLPSPVSPHPHPHTGMVTRDCGKFYAKESFGNNLTSLSSIV